MTPAHSQESMRSKAPPCPGNRLDESLTPNWRLIMLSPRSPRGVNMARIRPSRAAFHTEIVDSGPAPTLHARVSKAAPRLPVRMPARYPSQLFLGLSRGLSLRLPNLRPIKYAPESANQTAGSAMRNHHLPSG